MKKFFQAGVVIGTAILISLSAQAGATGQVISFNSGNSATVYNRGNNTGSCNISAFGGEYSSLYGSYTTVFRKGSLVTLQCSAKLVSGTPVTATQIDKSATCILVVLPSGVANLNCTKF